MPESAVFSSVTPMFGVSPKVCVFSTSWWMGFVACYSIVFSLACVSMQALLPFIQFADRTSVACITVFRMSASMKHLARLLPWWSYKLVGLQACTDTASVTVTVKIRLGHYIFYSFLVVVWLGLCRIRLEYQEPLYAITRSIPDLPQCVTAL